MDWQLVEPHNSAHNIGDQIRLYTGFDGNANVMTFQFHNQGTIDSSITEIAFDTGGGFAGFGVLGGAAENTANWILNGPGVKYTAIKDQMVGLSPWGFNNESFVITTGAQPESKGGIAHNGIDADQAGTEWVRLSFTVAGEAQYYSILQELGRSFRVGVHVQALPDGQSDAYLTIFNEDSPLVVPEPGTILAALLLLMPLGASTIRILRRK